MVVGKMIRQIYWLCSHSVLSSFLLRHSTFPLYNLEWWKRLNSTPRTFPGCWIKHTSLVTSHQLLSTLHIGGSLLWISQYVKTKSQHYGKQHLSCFALWQAESVKISQRQAASINISLQQATSIKILLQLAAPVKITLTQAVPVKTSKRQNVGLSSRICQPLPTSSPMKSTTSRQSGSWQDDNPNQSRNGRWRKQQRSSEFNVI